MSKLAFLFSGTGVTVGAGTILVGGLAVAGYMSGAFSKAPDAPVVAALVVQPEAEVPSVVKTPEVVATPKPEVVETVVAPPEPEVIEIAPQTPSFDVVRVETDGAAMIAGSAEAGTTIAVRLDNTVVERVQVDRSGKFASFVTLPESKDARVLTLDAGDTRPPKERVIIAPTALPKAMPKALQPEPEATVEIADVPKEVAPQTDAPKGVALAKVEEPADVAPVVVEKQPAVEKQPVVASKPEPKPAAPKIEVAENVAEIVEPLVPEPTSVEIKEPQPQVAETEPQKEVPSEIVAAIEEPVEAPVAQSTVAKEAVEKPAEQPAVAQIPVEAPAEPQLPVVLLATDEGVRILQSPNAPRPDAMTSLLASISYDDAGDVSLTGSGNGEFVRVYLDNRPVATTQIAASGDWQTGLPSVDTGIYTLRVDELNDAGDVVARVETPFKRETPEILAAATKPEKLVQAVTVQPGATLWAIAQEKYGSGTLYARVVAANADTIKDPDLIYPGQVFTVPD